MAVKLYTLSKCPISGCRVKSTNLQFLEFGELLTTSNKYSFRKELGLRLATIYSWCLLNKPLHISKADTKISIGGFQARVRGAGFIPCLGWNTIKTP